MRAFTIFTKTSKQCDEKWINKMDESNKNLKKKISVNHLDQQTCISNIIKSKWKITAIFLYFIKRKYINICYNTGSMTEHMQIKGTLLWEGF